MIEGVSGTGKTSVCHELRRRGYHALNGDRDLRADRDGEGPQQLADASFRDEAARAAWIHSQSVWDASKVRSQIDNHRFVLSFFCGSFRNHASLIGLFDGVFVLDVDRETLIRRLATRPPDEFGGKQAERELILRLHKTREDIPRTGIIIDATVPIEEVADDIVGRCG